MSLTVTALVIVVAGALLWKLLQPAPLPPGARPAVESVNGLSLVSEKVTHVHLQCDNRSTSFR